MKDGASNVNHRIAARIRELRGSRRLSLEKLAALSGVSRSMISLIERGESSPTAVLLEKLAAALGVPLASLFDVPKTASPDRTEPVSRHAEQTRWQDPASGYVRRNVSPPTVPQPIQITEVHFPAGARVAFESPGGETRGHQQIWILCGTMDVSVASERYRLNTGDCLAVTLDRPMMFHNPTKKPARYIVVVAAASRSRI